MMVYNYFKYEFRKNEYQAYIDFIIIKSVYNNIFMRYLRRRRYN